MIRGGWMVLSIAVVVGAGCATTEEDLTGPEACVIVDNTGGVGTQERIFLLSVSSGWRIGMGDVGMGDTLEFCTRRIRGAERVYIVIERPAPGERSPSLIWTDSGYIRSREFTLQPNDIWTWHIDLNQLNRAIRF